MLIVETFGQSITFEAGGLSNGSSLNSNMKSSTSSSKNESSVIATLNDR